MALALMLSITAFLSKTWFDGVNANAIELSRLKEENIQIVERLKGHEILCNEKFDNIKEKLSEIGFKLDKIILSQKRAQ